MLKHIKELNYFIPFTVTPPKGLIRPEDKICLLGSCFTEHIGARLRQYGWRIFENPAGIVFNPNSIYKTIERVVNKREIEASELFQHETLWHHWEFHSRCSHIEKSEALKIMNNAMLTAHSFLQNADWVFITLGTAYQYFLKENNQGVSNCHRVPAARFEKRLLSIAEIVADVEKSIELIKKMNPNIRFLFTISPVRHIKDGVVENNRSKARLIEAVHQICDNDTKIYFPAYELMIDVLRDYRFYDIDLVHPNYAATQSVWEFFTTHFMNASAHEFLKETIQIYDAYQHRSRFPEAAAHQKFLQQSLLKTQNIKKKYPFWEDQIYLDYFKTGLKK